MRKILFAVMAFTASAAFAQPAVDQPQYAEPDLIVKVSTLQGTYAQFFNQIVKVCPKPSLQMSESAGTVAALNDLLTNQANVAFMTAPVLYGKKIIEADSSVDNLRVIMPLYTAEMHIVANRADPTINKFSDVGNKRVATFGGAYITARIILSQAQLRPITLQDYQSEAAALKALAAQQVDVVFIEVGQPAKWAKELNGQQFKLVEFDQPQLLGRNGFVQATLRYPNLSQTAVRTLGSQVYLITQNYESTKKVQDISDLKECITTHIADLRETTGNHAKWREVKPNDRSDWPMFQVKNSEARKATKKK